jgi:hypothetical protein
MTARGNGSRGAAVVELCLLLPLAVALLFASRVFTDLTLARLEVQEAARFAAWEMTRRSLDDFQDGNHLGFFERASSAAVREAHEQFGGRGVASKISLTVTGDPALPGPLGGWDFNLGGKVAAQASTEFGHPLLFKNRTEGGPRFELIERAGFALRERHVLLASDWHLPDGEDAVMRNGRAGMHPDEDRTHLLYSQVARMTFLGAPERVPAVQGLSTFLQTLNGRAPDPMGTFVVSHNYGALSATTGGSRSCTNMPSYPRRARSGLNDLRVASRVDAARPGCFDTAPFRDQASHARSLYVQMFQARGAFHQGCRMAQANDPSTATDYLSDGSPKILCGGF